MLHAGGGCRGRCGRVRLVQTRGEMVAALTAVGATVVGGVAPFVLFSVPDAELMRKRLDAKGIAVRRCDTFVGLEGPVPARRSTPRLASAGRCGRRGTAMSALLSDVIDLLEAAYPPALAQDCGTRWAWLLATRATTSTP